jgi:hypothetical protein
MSCLQKRHPLIRNLFINSTSSTKSRLTPFHMFAYSSHVLDSCNDRRSFRCGTLDPGVGIARRGTVLYSCSLNNLLLAELEQEDNNKHGLHNNVLPHFMDHFLRLRRCSDPARSPNYECNDSTRR